MSACHERAQAAILSERGGLSQPIKLCQAAWDGHRSVRLLMPRRDIGLATAAYSFNLTDQEKLEVAERIAWLWNLAATKGWSTTDIETMALAAQNEG